MWMETNLSFAFEPYWKILVKRATSKTKGVGRQKGCRHNVLDFMTNMYQA